MYDVIVIGGGAGGMVTAIRSAMRGKRVLLLEKSDRLGKKLLSTGNGHCNMGNVLPIDGKYNTDFVKPVLSRYDIDEQRDFFADLGLLTRVEANRVYPYSMQASTVSNVLRSALERYGVETHVSERVVSIENGFTVNGKYLAKKVILATGGIAVTGEDGNSLITRLGHKTVPVRPALVPFITDNKNIKGLRGIRAEVGLTLCLSGSSAKESTLGEVIFKDNGVSGTAVFTLSRALARADCEKAYLLIDFMPDYDYNAVCEIVKKYKGLDGVFHKEIAKNILRVAGTQDYRAIAKAVKSYRIDGVQLGSYELAQISVGGLSTSEFNPESLESKKVKGLYAIGEALDVDGECGGYNLMWAFGSALAVADNV